MKQIKKLTEYQKSRFKPTVDKWIKLGLSTEEADWEKFENNALKCYQFAGLKPVPIIRVQSPIVGALAASIADAIIRENSKNHNRAAVALPVYSDVYSAVYSAVESAVVSAVESAVDVAVDLSVHSAVISDVHSVVNSAVYSAVISSVLSVVDSAVVSSVLSVVDSSVVAAVNSAVNSAVYSAVYSAVNSVVVSSVNSAVNSFVVSSVNSAVNSAVDPAAVSPHRLSVHACFGGSMSAGWQAFLDFFVQECNLDLGDEMNQRMFAYRDAQTSAGFWWPNKHFIIVSNRPSEIHLDNGRLHNENGMAIKWRDGWGLYFLNGVRMPAKIVETPAEEISADEVLKEKNTQVRSEIIKKIGYSRMLQDLKAKELDSWREYSLYRIDNADVEPVVLLKMRCPSTGVFYCERVPPDMQTCREAIKWQFHGIDKEEFAVET